MQLNSRRLTDVSLLEKIQNGSVSINKAHEMIKAAEARKKAGIA